MLASKGLGDSSIGTLFLPQALIDRLQCLGAVGTRREGLDPLHGRFWIVGIDLGGVSAGNR